MKKGYNEFEDEDNQWRTIAIEYHSPEGRYQSPMYTRVFPDGDELVEIDVERYVLLIRNWGIRQHKRFKELDKYSRKIGR